jgi:hypothetical protein
MYTTKYVISTETRLCGTDLLKEKAVMLVYRCLIILLTLYILLSTGAAQTKILSPAVPTMLAPLGMKGSVRLETVGGLEADVQARLRALEQTNLPKDVLEAIWAARSRKWTLAGRSHQSPNHSSPRYSQTPYPSRADGAPMTSMAVRLQRLTQSCLME